MLLIEDPNTFSPSNLTVKKKGIKLPADNIAIYGVRWLANEMTADVCICYHACTIWSCVFVPSL